MVMKQKFCTRKMYGSLKEFSPDVDWKSVMKGNVTRARAMQVLWIAWHGRLPKKARLCRLGMLTYQDCVLCGDVESLDHLWFQCAGLKPIWESAFKWLNVMHDPQEWKEEITWLNTQRRKKVVKRGLSNAHLLRLYMNVGGT